MRRVFTVAGYGFSFKHILSASSKKKIILFLLLSWTTLAFLSLFYNSAKIITEVNEWSFLSDTEKRYKIFGDIYVFFVFIKKNTESNSHILIYSKDVRSQYLGIYYLYPRLIVTVNNDIDFKKIARTKKFNFLAIYGNKFDTNGYSRAASERAYILYKLDD